MHFCQGMIEEIRIAHTQPSHCEMTEQKPCCSMSSCEVNLHESNDSHDCCENQAYMDKMIDQQLVKILKLKTQLFVNQQTEVVRISDLLTATQQPLIFLEHIIECNAPPDYITNSQLLFYEG